MRSTKNASKILSVFFIVATLLIPRISDGATVAKSLSVSVSAVVEAPQPPEENDTIVRFIGLAYPNSEITIERNGAFLAGLFANSDAEFDTAIKMDPGTYIFSIYGEDADGIVGPTFNISVTLSAGVTLSITGIFLGPTIEADKQVVEEDESITFSGYTTPNSNVTLYINPETTSSYDISSDQNGFWTKTLVEGEDLLISGNHEVYVVTTISGGDASENSKVIPFTVAEPTVEPDDCTNSVKADLNCDGYVNLVDFSILMFYWQETQPAKARADINKDNIVNIVDFSIMMFYWTG